MLFAWNKTFSEFNIAISVLHCFILFEKSLLILLFHTIFSCYMSISYKKHVIRFEFVAQLENVFI